MTSPVPAQTSQVMTAEEYAVLGAKFREAGLDAQQIRQFLALVQTEVEKAAVVAGRQVAMAIADTFLNTITNVHDQTADRVYHSLLARNGGGRVARVLHQDCLNVALTERYGQVRPTITLPPQ